MDGIWMDLLEKDIISFQAGDAVAFGGICGATVLRNLIHWIQKSAREGGEIIPRQLSPTAISRHLPFSLATIKRALVRLEDKGAVRKTRIDGERTNSYALGEALEHRIKIPPIAKTVSPAPSSDGQAEIDPMAPPPPSPPDDFNFKAVVAANADFFSGYRENYTEEAGLKILAICWPIVANIPDRELFNRFSSSIADELLVAVNGLCKNADVDQQLVGLCSEMLIHAVRSEWHCNASNPLFLRAAYKLNLEVCRRRQTWLKELKLQRHLQDRERFASPDADREEQTLLAPAKKVRILRNGINALNKSGFLDENNDRKTDRIKVSKAGYKAAEEFFVVNPQWSASHVLGLLEQSAKLDDNPPEGGFDELWHARHGRHLSFLMKHLDTVINQLGRTASFPPFVMPTPVEIGTATAAPPPDEP